MPITIEIADEQSSHQLDRSRLNKAVRLVLEDAGIESAEISIAVVSDERIHELNHQYLRHDYPTDVLSFILDHDQDKRSLDGEIIVSADHAAAQAVQYGWSPRDELLLYVIHGCLHLVGYDDTTAESKQAMRQAEEKYLRQFGLEHRL